MTKRLSLCCFLLLVVSLAGCSSQPELPSLSPGATILAFGDSLTYGSGAKAHDSYPAVLSRLTGFEVVNAGIPGEVTATGLLRLPDLLDEVQPQLLILCHGGNDMLRKQDMGQLQQNLIAMVAMARQQGISVVMIAVPKPGLLLAPPDLYRQVAESQSLPIEMDVLSDILADRSLKSDTIHPNARGYRIMAEAVAELLRQTGAVN